MATDPNKKTLRHFQCRDYLWETFEQMSAELECSVDYLINESMRQYARSRGHAGGGNVTGASRAATDYPPQDERPPMPARPAAPPLPSSPSSNRPPPAAPRAGSAAALPAQRVPAIPSMPGAGGAAPPMPRIPSLGGASAPARPTPGMPAVPPAMPRGAPSLPPLRSPSVPGIPSRGSNPPGAPSLPRAPAGGVPPLPGGRPGGPPPMPAYSPAAQAGPAVLTAIYQGQRYPVDKEEFVIGRGQKTSDLVIKDSNVSRRHAVVVLHNGQYWIVDQQSTNGVEFMGAKIDRKRIDEGDVFKICDYEIAFTYR